MESGPYQLDYLAKFREKYTIDWVSYLIVAFVYIYASENHIRIDPFCVLVTKSQSCAIKGDSNR